MSAAKPLLKTCKMTLESRNLIRCECPKLARKSVVKDKLKMIHIQEKLLVWANFRVQAVFERCEATGKS